MLSDHIDTLPEPLYRALDILPDQTMAIKLANEYLDADDDLKLDLLAFFSLDDIQDFVEKTEKERLGI